jgi:2'-5' RNA ligase
MSGDAIDRGIEHRTDGDTLRTFIAIDLPTPILHALTTTQEQLQRYLRAHSRGEALRWSPIKNLHLTLRFLGDTTPHQRQQVQTRLEEVAATTTPFMLHVDANGQGLGGFPNLRQPRVLWVGLGGELEALGQLQTQIEAMAQALGFAPEEKAYTPHLTLARAARTADRRVLSQVGQAIDDYAQQSIHTEMLSFEADQVIFYQSELGAGGSRYTALARLPFAGT